MSRTKFEQDEDGETGFTKSRSNNSKLVPDDSVSARKLWLYGFCGCVLIGLVLFFGITAYSWHRSSANNMNIEQMVAELNEDNTRQMDTNNMVSFSALASKSADSRLIKKNSNKLSLCFGDVMRAETEDIKSVLVSNVNQLAEDKNGFYYTLDLKVTLAFDVNPGLYMRNIEQYTLSRRYMTIAYLVASSYSYFSTVKLVETGLDTKNKALIRTNEVVLCSDNPNIQNAKSCGAVSSSDLEGGLFVKNTKMIAMSKLVAWNGGNGKRKNMTRPRPPATATPKATDSNPNNDDESLTDSDQFDIVEADSHINHYKVADDFTKDLRMYNIVFYRPVPDANGQSPRFNNFKEEPCLTIKPDKCK